MQGGKRRSVHLEEALRLAPDPRQRAEIALEVAEAYAAVFGWVDAADAVERGLKKRYSLTAVFTTRRAFRVKPVLERVALLRSGTHTDAVAARGMAMVLAGRAAGVTRPMRLSACSRHKAAVWQPRPSPGLHLAAHHYSVALFQMSVAIFQSSPTFSPNDDIFSGNFLRRRAFGLQADCPNSWVSGPKRFHLHCAYLRIRDLLAHAFPHRLDGGSAFYHARARWEGGRILAVERSDPGKITLVKEIDKLRVRCLNLLGERGARCLFSACWAGAGLAASLSAGWASAGPISPAKNAITKGILCIIWSFSLAGDTRRTYEKYQALLPLTRATLSPLALFGVWIMAWFVVVAVSRYPHSFGAMKNVKPKSSSSMCGSREH